VGAGGGATTGAMTGGCKQTIKRSTEITHFGVGTTDIEELVDLPLLQVQEK
jgi:hypothetical protein